jgi:hypothetical protein
MPLTPESVAAASNAWVWVPDNATVVEDEQYSIVRLPDYFEYQLQVLEFRPSGPLRGAVDALLARARSFGVPKVRWEVRLDSPAGLAEELIARGAELVVTLDVLACDLRDGAPALPPAAMDGASCCYQSEAGESKPQSFELMDRVIPGSWAGHR